MRGFSAFKLESSLESIQARIHSGRLHQLRVVGQNDRLNAVPGTGLCQYAAHVGLHRRLGQVQARGYLRVRPALADDREDLALPVREGREAGVLLCPGLRAGASGFLVKDAQPEELLAGIRAVATGDAVVAPSLTRRLLDAYVHHLPSGAPERAPVMTGEDPRLSALTEREREILTVVGQGWTNTEIATRLHLAESTVKTHVGRILAKTNSRDRIQAVILAYDTGLVHPS